MNQSLRKALLLGLGTISYSKKKAEETIKEFIKENNINTKEGEEILKEYMSKAEEYRKEQQKNITEMINSAIDKAKVATQDDVKKLEDMIKGKPEKKTAPKRVVKKTAKKAVKKTVKTAEK